MASAKSSHLKFSWRTFLFGIVLLGFMFVAHDRFHSAFERMDLIAYDLRINTVSAHASSGEIVIATIDDRSISQLGQWPWPRLVLGRLVDALKDYKVKVIGFDAIFTEADKSDVARGPISQKLSTLGLTEVSIRDVLGPSNDEAFAAAMKAQGETVLGYAFQTHHLKGRLGTGKTAGYLDQIRVPGPLTYGIVRQAAGKSHDLIEAHAYEPPTQLLNSAARSIGFFDVDADADGEIRTEMTVIHFDRQYCAPLFIALADAFADGAPMELGVDQEGVSGVAVAGAGVPVEGDGAVFVNFRR